MSSYTIFHRGADVREGKCPASRSSVLKIGLPVSLEALSMPTRGAGRRYSSITLKVILSEKTKVYSRMRIGVYTSETKVQVMMMWDRHV